MAKTNIIHKPHELIFFQPQEKQKLTAITRLLLNGIVLFTQWQLQGQPVDPARWFSAPLDDVLELLGLTDSEGKYDYRTIKKHFKDIRTFSIEWRFYDDDNNLRERGTGLIDKYEFAHIKKSVIVSWQMDEHVQTLLKKPENLFARIDLELLAKMKSSGAAIALYEICRRYMTNKFGKEEGFTTAYDLDWWNLALTGNPQAKPEYKNFNRDTVQPAMALINGLLEREFDVRKEEVFFPGAKRRVMGLRFHMKERLKPELVEQNKSPLEIRMKALNLNTKQVLKLMKKYQDNPEYLEKHLAGAEFAVAKGLIKKTTAGWLYKALEDDFSYEENVSQIPTHASHKPASEIEPIKYVPPPDEPLKELSRKGAEDQFFDLKEEDRNLLWRQYLSTYSPESLRLIERVGGPKQNSPEFLNWLSSRLEEKRIISIYQQFGEEKRVDLKESYLGEYRFNRDVFNEELSNNQVRQTFCLWLVKKGFVEKQNTRVA